MCTNTFRVKDENLILKDRLHCRDSYCVDLFRFERDLREELNALRVIS